MPVACSSCFRWFSPYERRRFFTALDSDDIKRDLLISFVEAEDDDHGERRQTAERIRRRVTRFFTPNEMDSIEAFRAEYKKSGAREAQRETPRVSVVSAAPAFPLGTGPWGDLRARGGVSNAWDDIDGTSFKVRGPNYLTDKQKVQSEAALLDMVVLDVFEADCDIPQITPCREVGTIHRVRKAGETRPLLVLNFRITPFFLVIVWALPETLDGSPAEKLLWRFIHDMDDEERNKTLKVIPRILQGNFVARKAVGETPAILGKNIPLEYHHIGDVFEVSLGLAGSPSAMRLYNILKYAASSLEMELAVTLEGKTEDELPEQVISGFRITLPDVTTFRTVAVDSNDE
uniref:Protein ENHANCED DISEASE RESISTANCE 2 C-terminal domain-containing protein n=1 Tax=Noctiluca scintillans TaxID=2966 RepID=A0A7S0ZZ65_NOCSC